MQMMLRNKKSAEHRGPQRGDWKNIKIKTCTNPEMASQTTLNKVKLFYFLNITKMRKHIIIMETVDKQKRRKMHRFPCREETSCSSEATLNLPSRSLRE